MTISKNKRHMNESSSIINYSYYNNHTINFNKSKLVYEFNNQKIIVGAILIKRIPNINFSNETFQLSSAQLYNLLFYQMLSCLNFSTQHLINHVLFSATCLLFSLLLFLSLFYEIRTFCTLFLIIVWVPLTFEFCFHFTFMFLSV